MKHSSLDAWLFFLTMTSLLGIQVRFPAAGLVAPAKVVDVVLSPDGTLAGRVVDTRHRPRGGTIVNVHRGRRVVARTRTDADGRYAITDLPGGLYQFRVGDSLTLVRVWSAGTAPRGSRQSLASRGRRPGSSAAGNEESPSETTEPSPGDLFASPITSTVLVFAGIAGAIFLIAELDDDDPPASP
ncbi:MAG: hypothetical protein CM1200mP2_42410 [Planctomycetaceae bacterium]|nr:MAG: hypothetical protein CM1200mP2_42410 [Planctomycetaceae bacterium]